MPNILPLGDPVSIADFGAALYGPRWQSHLARDLGVSDRTVRRWAAGSHQVPDAVWQEIVVLIDQRRDALARLRAILAEPA